ncbi:MAG: type II toxin-antitoxin system death-on-curing family toxin [Bacteroidota bacterium]
MEYLEKEDLILINQMTIDRHGGNLVPPFNVFKESSLEYIVEIVKNKIFDNEIYPSVSDKAAIYMFSIISNHVFQDGNKRTGLEAGLLFLKLNGYTLAEQLSSIKHDGQIIPEEGLTTREILFNFTMELASGKVDVDGCKKWFEANIESIKK